MASRDSFIRKKRILQRMIAEKGNFVEIKYVGRLDNKQIFDLNDKEVAKAEGLHGHFHDKTIICLGEMDVVKGLDLELIGKELGKELSIEVKAQDGFGKKDSNLFHMVPLSKFKEHKVNPQPGMQITIDNKQGIVKSVSGGRILVDMNHPLAGKTLHYTITMTKLVENMQEQVQGFLELNLHLHDVKVEEKEGIVTVHFDLPQPMHKMIEETLKKRIPQLKELKFVKP